MSAVMPATGSVLAPSSRRTPTLSPARNASHNETVKLIADISLRQRSRDSSSSSRSSDPYASANSLIRCSSASSAAKERNKPVYSRSGW